MGELQPVPAVLQTEVMMFSQYKRRVQLLVRLPAAMDDISDLQRRGQGAAPIVIASQFLQIGQGFENRCLVRVAEEADEKHELVAQLKDKGIRQEVNGLH